MASIPRYKQFTVENIRNARKILREKKLILAPDSGKNQLLQLKNSKGETPGPPEPGEAMPLRWNNNADQ